MSAKLEKLINLLSDNVWHNIDQITTALEIPPNKIQPIITFLAETDIVQHNPATNQIKLNQNWKKLLIEQQGSNPETQTKQEAIAMGTIILPPKQQLIIQCTRITNLTDTNLELEIRLDSKIREIAINKIQ